MKAASALLALLPLVGCAGDDGARERADCQRRIVEAASPAASPPGGGAAAFAFVEQRLKGLERKGCSEDQIARAGLTAQAAGRIAAAAESVGDLRQAIEQGRSPSNDQAILEFAHELEQYEHRRAALQVDLERLAKEAEGR
ncbi:hypothetical protein [Allosphingosinicella sp.]|jgi:hypothetical protein|uniref:hypothetical protein n=1 Tax=Allosphingosinicella sp. TaxID=2823234 RepID=UPI002F20E52E